MIVCSCNALSDKTIRSCLSPGPDCPYTPAQVYRCLGCSPQCGRCARTIRQIMDSALPSVHSACTSRCNAKCPLSASEQDAATMVVETVDVVETADTVEVHETLQIRQFVGA
ncbi:(2Fe-2S)-binding protein [Microbaculum marinum]|uniref:Bacterioferritin-associated ferredoxin n=1 Tax=Microbaculum marinum TaxID=1764581 RepID=A0AAW9RF52_9HYPH